MGGDRRENLTQSLATSKLNSGQNMANPANNNEAKFNTKAFKRF
ncbi:hypothetical protein [Campylobacter concisus]|nr:hypothetical protein [Campylobacter concisus]